LSVSATSARSNNQLLSAHVIGDFTPIGARLYGLPAWTVGRCRLDSKEGIRPTRAMEFATLGLQEAEGAEGLVLIEIYSDAEVAVAAEAQHGAVVGKMWMAKSLCTRARQVPMAGRFDLNIMRGPDPPCDPTRASSPRCSYRPTRWRRFGKNAATDTAPAGSAIVFARRRSITCPDESGARYGRNIQYWIHCTDEKTDGRAAFAPRTNQTDCARIR
jgi:hypothetical protein